MTYSSMVGFGVILIITSLAGLIWWSQPGITRRNVAICIVGVLGSIIAGVGLAMALKPAETLTTCVYTITYTDQGGTAHTWAIASRPYRYYDSTMLTFEYQGLTISVPTANTMIAEQTVTVPAKR